MTAWSFTMEWTFIKEWLYWFGGYVARPRTVCLLALTAACGVLAGVPDLPLWGAHGLLLLALLLLLGDTVLLGT